MVEARPAQGRRAHLRLPTPAGEWSWSGPVRWQHYRGRRPIAPAECCLDVPLRCIDAALGGRSAGEHGSEWARAAPRQAASCRLFVRISTESCD